MQNSESISHNNRLTILIVDDDQSALDLLSEAIESLGFKIAQAKNASEAFAFVQANSSNLALIISDFNMPGGSGFDLRKMMLPSLVEIPFIIISGFVGREEALKAIDLKISGFLEKPFQIKTLKELVTKESAFRVNALNEDEELLVGFIEEGRTLLEEMESIVLSFEAQPGDIDAINRLFACAHTIKGTSGYFKPDTTNRFTHKFEDFIVKFRGSGLTVDSASAGVMLTAIDVIRELLKSLESHVAPRPLEDLVLIFNVETVAAKAGGSTSQVVQHRAEPKVDELKVSVALLDSFMERSGELTVLRNMVNKTLRLIETSHIQDPNVASLSVLLNEMHKTNVLMQDQMAELRKVTIRNVVKPLSRTVHDLSGQLKKKMKLEIRGEELRVDHMVADVLGKCLIHIVRNSADHGLEQPNDRVEQGKDPIGTIVISAEQSGENYVISVSDDGRGVNFDRVVKKVIENGLATAEELSKMPRSQVLEFIFMPGFSTAAAVTDVSGRGVGTDMVKTSVENIGGHIRIASETGKGSDFVLTIPVPKSVLIVNSLLVQANEHTFAVPQSNVRRVRRVECDDERIQQIKDRRFFSEGQTLLPLVHLAEVLDLENGERGSDRQMLSVAPPKSHIEVVWVETKFGDLGIEVDAILDVEDTVVKKVANWIGKLKVYAGATFLGDGRAGLVLDLDGVAQKMGGHAKLNVRAGYENSELSKVETIESQKSVKLLTFDIGSNTNYAVEQDELFRLEEFATTDFQSVGDLDAILYRETAMRILTVTGEKLNKCERSNWPVVVVKIDETLIGFVVHKIGGFTEFTKSEQNSASQFASVIAVDDRALTIVSLVALAKQVLEFQTDSSRSA